MTQEGQYEFRCVRCSYVLRGIAVDEMCPECGTPVAMSLRGGGAQGVSGLAIASMVCGIVSIPGVCLYGLGFAIGIVAVVLGEIANNRVKRGEASPSSKGYATAGRVCGWISIAAGLALIGVLAYVIIAGP